MATATLTRGDGYWIQQRRVYTSLASDANADWGHYVGHYTREYGNQGSYEADYAAGCVEYIVPSISDGLLSRTISVQCEFHSGRSGNVFAVLSTQAPYELEWRYGPTGGIISNEISVNYKDTILTFSVVDSVYLNKKTVYLYLYQKNKGNTSETGRAVTTVSFGNGEMSYSSPYKLSVTADSGSNVVVSRTASGSGSTGTVENDSVLYYGDKLKITFTPKSNYRIVSSLVNGSSFTSGNTHNVTSNVSIEAVSQALSSGVMATDANIESVSTITINSNNGSYLHTLEYSFNGLTGTIADKTNKTSIAWTVPSSFYSKIPNEKTGVCTIVCNTLSSSGELLGVEECSITVTASYDKCKPSVSGTVTDSNQSSVNITGNNKVLIRFLSDALCSIYASGVGGATINKMSINGVALDDGVAEMTFNSVEVTSFTFSATDSRGYTTEVTVEPEDVIPYVKLTINPVFSRPSATSGEILLTFDGNFYNGAICDINNTLDIKYRYRKIDEAINGAWITIPSSAYSTGSLTYKTETPFHVLDVDGNTTSFGYKENYEFQIQVQDGDGTTALSSITLTIPVLNGQPVYDWGANDFRFNVPVFFTAGCGGMVTLWKNESPNSEFAAQTISVNGICDEEAYPYIIITSQRSSVFMANSRGATNLSYCDCSSGGVLKATNREVYIDSGSVEFKDSICVTVSSSVSSQVLNNYNRPYAIIGVKAL